MTILLLGMTERLSEFRMNVLKAEIRREKMSRRYGVPPQAFWSRAEE